MRAYLFTFVGLTAMSLCLGVASAAATSPVDEVAVRDGSMSGLPGIVAGAFAPNLARRPTRVDATPAAVAVVLRAGACTVTPRVVDAGNVTFHVGNRTTHRASFALLRAVFVVGPKADRTWSLTLVVGQAHYVCTIAGRRVGTGLLVVRTPPLPPEHRIDVRDVNGIGEFYDRATGAKFIPRGNNYIRLAPQKNASGALQVYHPPSTSAAMTAHKPRLR